MNDLILRGKSIAQLISDDCRIKILKDITKHSKKDDTLYLYKYVPTWAAERIIIDRLLKFISPRHANDPFEFMPQLEDGYNIHDMMQIVKNSPFAATCFSLSCHTPAMWGHYADKGRGVCLCFKLTNCITSFLKNENEPFQPIILKDEEFCDEYIVPVMYSHERSKIKYWNSLSEQCQQEKSNASYENGMQEIDISALLAATTKDVSWQYEQEYRIIRPITAGMSIKNGAYFSQSITNKLAAVILAPYCEYDKNYFRLLLDSNNFKKVQVIRAEYNKTHYCFDTPGHKDNIQNEDGTYLKEIPIHAIAPAMLHSSLVKKAYLGYRRVK